MCPVVKDSRRVPGPNVVWPKACAVLDLAWDDAEAPRAVPAWRARARQMLDAVGWQQEECAERLFPGGATLALSSPLDTLYSATEINEWAWSAAQADLDGRKPEESLAEAAERLRARIAEERKPRLMALKAEADRRGICFIRDDRYVSCGMGRRSRAWPVERHPDAVDVPWEELGNVPVAVVTGTNGKSTTTRLLGAIIAAAGKTGGFSSTDFVKVGEETVETGDWAGPMGARLVLRHQEVDVAVLETARGGMLRRGLGMPWADVACVTNVAPDHLGEWGIADLDQLADVKFIVRHAAKRLVLNTEDEKSVERARACTQPITWFATRNNLPLIEAHARAGGTAVVADGSSLWLIEGTRRTAVADLSQIPITLGGAARFNVGNAAAAVGVALGLGLPLAAIRAGLAAFRSDERLNPGRLNEFNFSGVRALVDFAHNPHGQSALYEMARALPAQRRLVMVGHAGDRTDEDIREVALTAYRAGMDRILIKEQEKYLRGRAPGAIPGIMREALRAAGCPDERIGMHPDELDATRAALEWSRPGDLLLVLALAQREEVLAYLGAVRAAGWQPGQPVPLPDPG
jgi:UDP-N-acetylmuramyl tripeptide synthase